MDLLSPEEKEEVFGALGDVTDTFHKDTVTLVKFTKTATRMGTGKPGTSEETPLLCRVTKNSVPSDAEHNAQGVDDRNLIEIRFFNRYLIAQGFMEQGSNLTDIDCDTDYFKWEGLVYRPYRWGNDDTDFMGESALIVFFCRKEDEKA